MSEHPLVYRVAVGAFGFHVREIEGSEQLSQAWQLRLRFALDPQTMRGEPDDFDPDDVIKQSATITMERATETDRDLIERPRGGSTGTS